MEQPTPTGAESLTVDQAAQRISGILNPKPQTEVKAEPVETQTEPDAEQPETAEAEVTQEASPEKQELSFESLHDLAEALETPVDDLMGKVKARVKIAGVERDVTLAELRDGYQMESDYRKKTSELSEQRKAFDAERERLTTELNGKLAEAGQMTKFMEDQLMGEYNAIDWPALRRENAAEYAALQMEYNQRFTAIQGLKHQAVQSWQQQQKELQQKSTEEFQKILQEEQAKLVSVIPEFADETKAKQLKQEMREFLNGAGFSDQDISGIHDHRHVLIIRDAMKYRALQGKKPELTKKVINLPKVLKPGAAKSRNEIQQEQLRQKLTRLKKSGDLKDAASLLLERL